MYITQPSFQILSSKSTPETYLKHWTMSKTKKALHLPHKENECLVSEPKLLSNKYQQLDYLISEFNRTVIIVTLVGCEVMIWGLFTHRVGGGYSGLVKWRAGLLNLFRSSFSKSWALKFGLIRTCQKYTRVPPPPPLDPTSQLKNCKVYLLINICEYSIFLLQIDILGKNAVFSFLFYPAALVNVKTASFVALLFCYQMGGVKSSYKAG